jgi:hypothetical protein
MEFRAYQLVYYKGKLGETISRPTPDNTIMLRTTPYDPETMIEVSLSDIREPLDYLFQTVGDYTPAGLGKLIERVGMDHDSTTALLLVDHCLKQHLNLSHCWAKIRFFIHDVLRSGNPEWDREQVYTDTIQQLCDSVALFAKVIYDDNNNEVPGPTGSGCLPRSDREDIDLHSDLPEEGRDGEEDDLPEGREEAPSRR